MRVDHFAFILPTLLTLQLSAQPDKLNVAVNELAAQGVTRDEAAIFSERLRSEMINTGVFRVMERSEMATILKEQGFQKSGACDDQSCLVEVGQLLGVDRMVAGTAGRTGSFFTISLRMINVATGEIMFTVNEDCNSCDITMVIANSVKNAALKLAQGAGRDVARAFVAGMTGDLHVKTDMAGASLEIDGKNVKGETPLKLDDLPAGEHQIALEKLEYLSAKQLVTVGIGEVASVSIALKPAAQLV